MRLIAVLWLLASCGGAPLALSSSDDALARVRSAADEAEIRLEDEGIEDADGFVSTVLAAHGFCSADVEVVRYTALRAQLLSVAASLPHATAGELFAKTMDAWEAIATLPPDRRLAAVAGLAGFDPARAPVAISPEVVRAAAAHPESGLDARGRGQLAAARAAITAAIAQHLDLPSAQAAQRLLSLEQRARAAATRSAQAFSGLPAASAQDVSRAAARALRWSFIQLQDFGGVDEAWPMVAQVLGVELPPLARSGRPDLAVEGAACTATPGGLQCTSGGSVRLRLDDATIEAKGGDAASLLTSVLDALPRGIVGCAIDAGALRIDRTAGDVQVEVTPSALVLRGKLSAPGLRPQIVVGFQGNELRVLVRPVADLSAKAAFVESIPLSRRLPKRRYEVEVVDEAGTLLGAAALDRTAP